jgi:hypothetical protein
MEGWSEFWTRMTPDERHRAAEAYLEDVERHPASREAAIQYIAIECKSRPQAVRRLGLSKRAARLARVRGLPAPYLHNFVVSFHRRRRAPMLARFLTLAGIEHVDGFVDVSKSTEPAPLDRLVVAVRALKAEFPTAEVTRYLDALELQAEKPWAQLSEARRAVAQDGAGVSDAGNGAPG